MLQKLVLTPSDSHKMSSCSTRHYRHSCRPSHSQRDGNPIADRHDGGKKPTILVQTVGKFDYAGGGLVMFFPQHLARPEQIVGDEQSPLRSLAAARSIVCG